MLARLVLSDRSTDAFQQSSDTVEGMIHYELDAMFMYTVTMGMVGMLMAWEVVVLAIKGWAVRKERQAKTHQLAQTM